MLKQVNRGPLSETATVASQLGQPGEWRFGTGTDAGWYQLVYINSTASYGHVLQSFTGATNVGYWVVPLIVSNVKPVGVLNQIATNATVAASTYAWVQRKGMGVCSIASTASVDVNLPLMPTDSAGLMASVISDVPGRAMCGGYSFKSVDTGPQQIMIDMI
jgi:hypothetical protein